MGAQLWQHLTPWRPEPESALFELQAHFVTDTYDLPSLVQEHLESAREAVHITEAEGDEYGLLDLYRNELAMLEEAASGPLPVDPRRQIDLVRKLYMNSGEGIGNILDVTRISDQRDIHTAMRLTEAEMERLIGTIRPTMSHVRQAVGKINEELGSGESVCFPVYNDQPDNSTPIGWYFVGNTID